MVAWVFNVKENMAYWFNDLQTWTKITCTQAVSASGYDKYVYKLWVSMEQMAKENNLSFLENNVKKCKQCYKLMKKYALLVLFTCSQSLRYN